MEYTGSWVRQPVTTGCEGLLEDPYNQEQCAAQCACNREKVGHTIMTITGEHDDTTSSLRMITTKKYTPLGLLWNVPFIDMDYQSNSQGNVYMECTYSVEQCGIQANNLCGGYYTSLTKPGGVYSWDTPDTVEYGENMKTIIPHTSENDYYYNTITGHIHADSQQVLQIHYHALDIQEKDFATLMPPEIYVYAQLNRHEGVYDKTNDRINFTTQDGRRNEDFESAIESLIEYAMSNTGGGITPQGIEASFVLVK